MRAPARFTIAAFLAMIASAAAIQLLSEARSGQRPAALELFTQRPSRENLRAFEQGLQDRSITARTLRPWMQAAQFLTLREGGDRVLAGPNGWLFYQPGVAALTQRPGPKDASAALALGAVVAFRDALAARGIRLIVVPAPNKESVYPDQLAAGARPPERINNPETRAFFNGCKTAGVEVVDLFALYRNARVASAVPLYLAQDSHWSPAGMALAAQTVARQLDARNPSPFDARPAALERHGDLVQMLRSPALEERLAPETIECVQIVRSESSAPYADDPASDVLVLGDSFLRIYQTDAPGGAGFIAHLAAALGRPVSSIVNDGGGATLVRQELSRRPRLLEGKKVVIWEFAERDLRLATEGWAPVPLPAP